MLGRRSPRSFQAESGVHHMEAGQALVSLDGQCSLKHFECSRELEGIRVVPRKINPFRLFVREKGFLVIALHRGTVHRGTVRQEMKITAQTLKKFDQNDSNLAKPNTRETQRIQSNAEEEKGGNMEYCFFCVLTQDKDWLPGQIF
jgi:hypothetical protein